MKICNKADFWDFCHLCHHGKPHEKITERNIKQYSVLDETVFETITCDSTAICTNEEGRKISIKCIPYYENAEKIKNIRELIRTNVRVAANIYDNIEEINKIMEKEK